MSDNVVFEDYSVKVKERLRSLATTFLHEVGGELRSTVQRESRRDTSQTAGSYKYVVDEADLVCQVGSDSENAIWEEFGTGIHAVHGDGRKTPWVYTDRFGKKHRTRGKTANRPMERAYTMTKPKIERRANEIFGGLNND